MSKAFSPKERQLTYISPGLISVIQKMPAIFCYLSLEAAGRKESFHYPQSFSQKEIAEDQIKK